MFTKVKNETMANKNGKNHHRTFILHMIDGIRHTLYNHSNYPITHANLKLTMLNLTYLGDVQLIFRHPECNVLCVPTMVVSAQHIPRVVMNVKLASS